MLTILYLSNLHEQQMNQQISLTNSIIQQFTGLQAFHSYKVTLAMSYQYEKNSPTTIILS